MIWEDRDRETKKKYEMGVEKGLRKSEPNGCLKKWCLGILSSVVIFFCICLGIVIYTEPVIDTPRVYGNPKK